MQKLVVNTGDLEFYDVVFKIVNKLMQCGYKVEGLESAQRDKEIEVYIKDIESASLCFYCGCIEIQVEESCNFGIFSHLRNNINDKIQELLNEKVVEEGSEKYGEIRR